MTTRGIKNVTGVSCHISCALQIIFHTLVPVRNALQKNKAGGNEKSFQSTRILGQLAELVQALYASPPLSIEASSVDPSVLYKSLENFSSSKSARLSLDPHEVGDSSTAITLLLRILSEQSPDWATLVDHCIAGWTSYTIVGVKKTTTKIITRTKNGKMKQMPCPFPLVGTFDSLQDSLSIVFEPQHVTSYNWNDSNPQTYQESIREVDYNDNQQEVDTPWNTNKTIHMESWPKYCFFHLERFSYDSSANRILGNPRIEIPLTFNRNEVVGGSSESSPIIDNQHLELLGGILHVIDSGRIEEEGHYVSLLRNFPQNNGQLESSSSSTWILVDDETCTTVDDDQSALALLRGKEGRDGKFYCATLVVYGAYECLHNDASPLGQLVEKLQQEGPKDLIGRRLKVKWAKNKFFEGTIHSYDAFTQKHRVVYDDGDEKEYILSEKTIEWV